MDQRSAVTIAIANQKGGVGKTTTAVAISAALADLGDRVITIDCDPQASASAATGFNLRQDYTSLYDPMRDAAANLPATLQDALTPLEARWGLVPAHINLAAMERDLFQSDSREWVLRDLISPLTLLADWIIIDCPPALGLLTINALIAADCVLVPQVPDVLSAQGLQELVKTVDRVNRMRARSHLAPLSWAGVVLTKVRAHLEPHAAMRAQIAAFCAARQIPFLSATPEERASGTTGQKVEIPDTITAAKAAEEGIAMSRYPGGDGGRAAYRKLAALLRTEVLTHAS